MENYPPDVYMSPRNAVSRFQQLLLKHGADVVEKAGAFKIEKELLIAGIMLCGLQSANKFPYYLRPGEDIFPNVDVRAITWGEDNDHFEEIDIQVTEFESHNQNLVQVINAKVRHQAQKGIENRHLIVNVRENPGQRFSTIEIAREIRDLKPTFKSIWVIIDDADEQWLYHAMGVWPIRNGQVAMLSFNLEEVIADGTPPDYVRIRRGARNENLSDLYNGFVLPLP
jgi:hypothetical protein